MLQSHISYARRRLQICLCKILMICNKKAFRFIFFTIAFVLLINLCIWIGIVQALGNRALYRDLNIEPPVMTKRLVSDCQSEYNAYSVHPEGYLFHRNETDVLCHRAFIEPRNACQFIFDKLSRERNQCTAKRNTFCKTVKDENAIVSYDCTFAKQRCLVAEIGWLHQKNGSVKFTRVDPEHLAGELADLHASRNYDFAFVRCVLQGYGRYVSTESVSKFYDKRWHKGSKEEDREPPIYAGIIKPNRTLKNFSGEQLIQFIHKPLNRGTNIDGSKLSFSFVFVDSLSRTGAYQSMPRTIDFLKSLNKRTPERALDYKLMHAIFPGTYWNLENHWMGDSAQSLIKDEFYYFEFKIMSQPFQKQGYAAAYLHDTCYHWPWRTEARLSKPNRLEMYYKEFNRSGLNTTGITLATCEILKRSTGEFKAFTSKDVCQNGDYEVMYRLDNMYNIQRNWLDHDYPFVTFNEMNINHNGDGTNVLHLDLHLKNYLEKISKEPNVLTMVFSDHGNRFDPAYMQDNFPEGQTDVMHPFLFMVLPENPERFFEPDELEAMKINQNRLITPRDVHYIARKFRDPNTRLNEKRGLLAVISKNRTCANLTFTKGNFFCICEPAINESFNMEDKDIEVVVNYSRAHLNTQRNTVHCQYMDLVRWGNKPFKLFPNKTRNEPSIIKGYLFTTFENRNVIFSIEVKKNMTTEKLNFKTFLRLDEYRRFQDCTPSNIDAKVCLCKRTVTKSVIEVPADKSPQQRPIRVHSKQS